MKMQFKVPSIACEVCGQTITKAIVNEQPEAKVEVNVETKTVAVATEASAAAIQKIIEAAGHTVESLTNSGAG